MEKSFKQTLALLLSMIMLICAMPIVNATNNNVSISVSNATVNATENVTFTVIISGTENAKSAAVDVTFGDNFEFVTGQWLKTGSIAQYDTNTNKGTFLLGTEAGNMNGNLFELTLKAKDVNAQNQAISINVQMKNSDKDILDETGMATVNIAKRDFGNITFNGNECEYDGKEKKLTIGGTLPEGSKVNYTNEKGTDAGTYNATAKITCAGYNDKTLNATLKINPKELTITGLSAQNKTYDGTDKATLSGGVLNGKISGDDVSANIPTEGKFADKNVGNNKTVTINTITLSGTKKDNYTLTQPTGLKANITQKVISVTSDNQQMIKNGTMPALTYSYAPDALCDGDSFTGELTTRADGTKTGDFEIEIGNLSAGNNYKINFTKGTLKVSDKTPQTITVADFSEKTYGDEAFKVIVTPDATSNLSNFTYVSDNENVATISADGTITIKGAGDANITVTEAGNADYAQASVTKKLTVVKKAITLKSIDAENKTAVLEGILASDESDVTLDFDKINVTLGDAVGETTSNAVLTNFVLKGDKAANYNITTETLNTTVAHENVVTVTITAENGTATGAAKYLKDAEVTVSATPNSGYKFDGWYNGDTSVSTSASYTFKAESDITLVAKFSRKSTGGGGGGGSSVSTYTVKFETNGGSTIDSIKVDKNKTVAEPTAPAKDGFEFAGWYTDKALTTKYDFDTKVTKGITLYAAWTEKKAEVKDDNTEPTTLENKITFTDVKENDWFAENVKYVAENGLMNGTTETEFAPNDNLTRAMLVTILYRAEDEPETNKSVPFADVTADSYYANAVIWAQQNGIVSGVNENEFAPDENITREQIATIIYRYANYKGYDASSKADISAYADADEISDYATEAMQYAVGSGLIKGKTETTLNPQDNATRAEIAAILQRFIEANK